MFGSGGAAKKHIRAYEELPHLFRVTEEFNYDIADICGKSFSHFHVMLDQLLHVDVIVEKPVCGSLVEMDQLERFERVYRHRVCPIFQYRFAGHDPVELEITSRWNRDRDYYSGWRGEWDTALGGCLTSHGIHILDLMIQRYGMPEQVLAMMRFAVDVETLADVCIWWNKNFGHLSVVAAPGIIDRGFNLGNSHDGYVRQFTKIYEALTFDVQGGSLVAIGGATDPLAGTSVIRLSADCLLIAMSVLPPMAL